MSATMDVDAMRTYFTPEGSRGPIPVIWIEGRTHKVDVYQTVKVQEDYLMASLTTLFMIHQTASVK
jgi:HrpA-like RNA helicase